MDDELRKQCKLLKAMYGVSYKEIASYIEIKQDSFYSWLKGYYDLSLMRKQRLAEILDLLKGV